MPGRARAGTVRAWSYHRSVGHGRAIPSRSHGPPSGGASGSPRGCLGPGTSRSARSRPGDRRRRSGDAARSRARDPLLRGGRRDLVRGRRAASGRSLVPDEPAGRLGHEPDGAAETDRVLRFVAVGSLPAVARGLGLAEVADDSRNLSFRDVAPVAEPFAREEVPAAERTERHCPATVWVHSDGTGPFPPAPV